MANKLDMNALVRFKDLEKQAYFEYVFLRDHINDLRPNEISFVLDKLELIKTYIVEFFVKYKDSYTEVLTQEMNQVLITANSHYIEVVKLLLKRANIKNV